jgi:acyl CoA:acetate/3-ketoacid CoA transferase beta subunit
VIAVPSNGLVVREMAPGLEFAELKKQTSAKLRLANDWRVIEV